MYAQGNVTQSEAYANLTGYAQYNVTIDPEDGYWIMTDISFQVGDN